MKKALFTLAVFVMALCANAQTNQYFWYQGNLMLGTEIAQIDSVTFGDGESTDTLHILLPRTIIKTIRETVYVTIHDTVCPNAIPEGALAGEFSVSAIKKVRFSKGNLQYQASADTWRFAENQWDFVGNSTLGTVYENGIKCNNALLSSTYNGWIDLFAWGTGNQQSMYNCDDNSESSFIDWGKNAISNGGNKVNLFRTLTDEEYNYLISERTNFTNLRGSATVCDIHGFIILPDDWETPTGLYFYPNPEEEWYSLTLESCEKNIYTKEQWKQMEERGAVFLPCAGDGDGFYCNQLGCYWVTPPYVYDLEYQHIYFESCDSYNGTARENWGGKCGRKSVRLVQDVE